MKESEQSAPTPPGTSEQREQAPASAPPAPVPSTELPAEDFYFEGPYVVFTAAYHLKRGYCCNSDCRHCPYR